MLVTSPPQAAARIANADSQQQFSLLNCRRQPQAGHKRKSRLATLHPPSPQLRSFDYKNSFGAPLHRYMAFLRLQRLPLPSQQPGDIYQSALSPGDVCCSLRAAHSSFVVVLARINATRGNDGQRSNSDNSVACCSTRSAGSSNRLASPGRWRLDRRHPPAIEPFFSFAKHELRRTLSISVTFPHSIQLHTTTRSLVVRRAFRQRASTSATSNSPALERDRSHRLQPASRSDLACRTGDIR